MSLTQYIGARYVPIFFENEVQTPEWRANTIYEPLTIVTYANSSYTSKKYVPAGVGDPVNNPDYWACTGNYNAQISQLQNDVLNAQNDILALDGDLNGNIKVIKSAFDTTLANGKASKTISGASFEALNITPDNSFIVGCCGYNNDSGNYWSNDSYPADYINIKMDTDTVTVTNLAPNAFVEKQIAGFTGKRILGVTVEWATTTVLNPTYIVKGDKIYINIENIHTSNVSDTGTIKVYYEDAQADELVKANQIPCINAKLRYDANNKPYLQVESILPSQYDVGDEFKVAIYTLTGSTINF